MELLTYLMFLLLVVSKSEDLSVSEEEQSKFTNPMEQYERNDDTHFQDWINDSNHINLKTLISDIGRKAYEKCLNESMQVERNLTLDNNDMQYCLLSEKWLQKIKTKSIRSRRIFFSEYENYFTFDRKIDPNSKHNFDCLWKTRFNTRKVPKDDCYWKTMQHSAKEEFSKIWNDIGPDIGFTFDFVLYSENFPNRIEDQFWYLIAYLKLIVMNIENPITIVKKCYTKIDEENKITVMNRVNELRSRLTALDEYIKRTLDTYTAMETGEAIGNAFSRLRFYNNIEVIGSKKDKIIVPPGPPPGAAGLGNAVAQEVLGELGNKAMEELGRDRHLGPSTKSDAE